VLVAVAREALRIFVLRVTVFYMEVVAWVAVLPEAPQIVVTQVVLLYGVEV
jgi:hypothetical protein